MRPLFTEAAQLVKQYEKIGKELTDPWMKLGADEIFKKITEGDNSAYTDFYKALTKAYENSYGKIFNAIGIGPTREQSEQVMGEFDSFYKMLISMTEMMALVSDVARENMVTVIETFQQLAKEGKQPQSLREFYNLWVKINEDAFVKVFGTPQFSRIFCDFAKKSCDFKIHFDKVMEQFLNWAPIPKNSDMINLYRTVYELRKSDYRNTQQLAAVREELAALRAAVGDLNKPGKKGDK